MIIISMILPLQHMACQIMIQMNSLWMGAGWEGGREDVLREGEGRGRARWEWKG